MTTQQSHYMFTSNDIFQNFKPQSLISSKNYILNWLAISSGHVHVKPSDFVSFRNTGFCVLLKNIRYNAVQLSIRLNIIHYTA